jgi:hypothetical protein
METNANVPPSSRSGSLFRKILKISGITLGIIFSLIILLAIVIEISPRGRIVLPVKHRPQFDASIYNSPGGSAAFPAPLQAHGNQLLTPDGTPVRLRGLMPPDPALLDTRGKFDREFYAQIHEAGANVIRISVHPDYWLGDADYLWRHIDPIVGWAGQMNMYAIIDWHYIGNIQTGQGPEMPDIDQRPSELTLEFWRQISAYFRTTPHVIFEIWNEPAGGIQADTWQKYAVQIIRTIRDQGARQLVIVGGVEYSRDLSWVLDNPIPDNNVAYTSHIYPAHTNLLWDHWFGEASEVVPVLVTEWGFMDENREGAPFYLAGSAENYGEPFLEYLDDHGIGWVACWYDDEWDPPMFNQGWKAPTNYGTFVFEKLKEVQP